jgi:hypothetical protein
MDRLTRAVFVLFLLGVVVACGNQALAAREAPPNSWWAYWLLDGAVAAVSLLGVVWLARPTRTSA